MAIWNTALPSITLDNPVKLVPQKVLYEYDGPLIFVVDGPMGKQLFYKIEEQEDGCGLFLATSTNVTVLSALEKGNLSIKGALFEGGGQRIVQTSPDLQMIRYWEQYFED